MTEKQNINIKPYIDVYYRPMHESLEARLDETECVIFSVLLSFLPSETRGGRTAPFNISRMSFLGLTDKEIRYVLASLVDKGYIKLDIALNGKGGKVTILKSPQGKYGQVFKIYRHDFVDGLTIGELLHVTYADHFYEKYNCLDLDRFLGCGYWDKETINSRVGSHGMPRYIIGDRVYCIPQYMVDTLELTNYTPEDYKAVESFNSKYVYELVHYTKVSAARVLQILYKMGHVKPLPFNA